MIKFYLSLKNKERYFDIKIIYIINDIDYTNYNNQFTKQYNIFH
jgi:hypothetical protein